MKSRRRDFDVLVIGAGSAGFAAALTARATGAAVGIIERGKLGGECPNYACVPTKALLHSAGKMPWAKAVARKDAMVKVLTGSRLSSLLVQHGIAHIKGSATFVDAHTVLVGGREWTADAFVIAAGTVTDVPAVPGLEKAGYLTYADAVSLKKLPKSIAILGGGPVGVEFAEIMHGFGVATTLIQHAPRLVAREEPEVSSVIEASFRDRGMQIYAGAEMIAVEKSKGQRVLTIRQGRMEFDVKAEAILVATGKRSVASEMLVGRAGVHVDAQGYIVTDKFLRTSAKHIFAAGDVKAGFQFTHVAAYDGDIAGHNVIAQKPIPADYHVVPRGTFCFPEIGSVGLTEEEARAIGKWKVGVGKAFFAGFGKALTRGDGEGLVKIVADLKTGTILGAGIVGDCASELIHEIAIAMKVGATYHDIADMMHAYPTGSEAVKMACASVE